MPTIKGPSQQIKVTLPSRGGFTGSSGSIGFTGSQGNLGYTGSQGNLGYTGSQGAGFTGSQGIQGTTGYTGSQGNLGYTGSQGAGFTGSQGDTGFTGSQGNLGYTGSQGAGFTGSQGDTGFTGSEGNLDITTSSTPPVGAQYGDVWLDEATGIQYFYFNDGNTDQWVEFSNVGSQGYTGSRGNIGFTGSTGTGYTGSQGVIGYTGSRGNIGFIGSQGPIGYTGSQGPAGEGSADIGDITFNGVKIIGAGTASGDGAGYSTIELVPDNDLYNITPSGDFGYGGQYLVIDPTSPNHIHIRAGGPQDEAAAQLILGGEKANVIIRDQDNSFTENHQVIINTQANDGTPYVWQFNNNGQLIFPNNTTQSTAWAGGRVVTVPISSTGSTGDLQGDIAFSNGYIYYCTANYGSGGNIWKRVAWSLDTW